MGELFVALGVSLLVTMLLVRSAAGHVHLSGDVALSGPQKFHAEAVPRVGGIGILLGVWIGALYAAGQQGRSLSELLVLVACGLAAFSAGLLEDFTKKVSPRLRLFSTGLSAVAAAWLLEAVIRRTDIFLVDPLLVFTPVAIGFTVFVISGVANSVNIIDGFNGLASMCVVLMLLALGHVGQQVGDHLIVTGALVGVGAVLGFFAWNYPRGLIFLGDGGAYFLGFYLAELGVLLVLRNPQVSPVFPLLLMGYPIFETMFTMYRRKVVSRRSMDQPDAAHLHSLVYRRVLRRMAGGRPDAALQTRRNAMTSPYLWALCSLAVLPAMLWWHSSAVLGAFIGLYCASYVWLYRRIVRFRTPRLLVLRLRARLARPLPRARP